MKERKNKADETRELSPFVWITIAVILLAIGATRCCAQKQPAVLDTVVCKVQCIQKYIPHTTKSGNVSYKVIYIDKEVGVQEIIPVSKSVYQYIQECKEYGFEPQLGIKLRNGEISSIIRLKTKYRRIKR